MERYGDEQSCLDAVARSKWPCGFRCRRCGSDRNRRFARQGQSIRQCSACGKQESVLANTAFAETKLPLRTWFMAMYFLFTTKNNVSALELKRHLGTCYRTAWRMKHKLMEAMATCEASRVLKGRIEMDDTYLGGEFQGGKVGRGSENKQAFIVAVSTTADGRPREVVFEPVRSFSKVAGEYPPALCFGGKSMLAIRETFVTPIRAERRRVKSSARKCSARQCRRHTD